jgi:hypothetical protein
MNINIDEMKKKIHTKIDCSIDHMNTAKNHLQSCLGETEATIQKKMKAAKEILESKKQEATAAMKSLEELVVTRKAETETAVGEWKAKHDRNKLEKRAERAEKYVEDCVALALYYSGEAEVAILEAAVARKDADDVA